MACNKITSKIGAIIVCAGRGERLGLNKAKALVKIDKYPLFLYSYRIFKAMDIFNPVVLVVNKDSKETIKKYVSKDRNTFLVLGGKERKDSVRLGLRALGEDVEYVIVHDGARPFVRKDMLKRIIQAMFKYSAVTLGIKLRDALKEVKAGFIQRSLLRKHYYLIQTPQAFKKNLLEEAHQHFLKTSVYDDAEMVEKLGQRVKVIEGEVTNIKITYPQDLILARSILKIFKEDRGVRQK